MLCCTLVVSRTVYNEQLDVLMSGDGGNGETFSGPTM